MTTKEKKMKRILILICGIAACGPAESIKENQLESINICDELINSCRKKIEPSTVTLLLQGDGQVRVYTLNPERTKYEWILLDLPSEIIYTNVKAGDHFFASVTGDGRVIADLILNECKVFAHAKAEGEGVSIRVMGTPLTDLIGDTSE